MRMAAFGVIHDCTCAPVHRRTQKGPGSGVSRSVLPDYDTTTGILNVYLHDLNGLNRLMQDRMEAAYKRKERLHEFIIMGRWATDACGNFGDVEFLDDNYKPLPIPFELPLVLETDRRTNYGLDYMSTRLTRSSVPPPHLICRECGKGWTLKNAYDTVYRSDTEKMDLSPYVEKTLREINPTFDGRSDAKRFFGNEPSVRNDNLIDLTLDECGAPKNERGWNHERLSLDYVVQPGDEGLVHKIEYAHKRCHTLEVERTTRQQFEKVLRDAGYERYVMDAIPNGYHRDGQGPPWFVVKMPFGDIVIGWRKHVMQIDWESTKKDLSHLFREEDVTKGPFYIHAWGLEKATRYLARIREALA